MDSFEINPGDYDLSALRQRERQTDNGSNGDHGTQNDSGTADQRPAATCLNESQHTAELSHKTVTTQHNRRQQTAAQESIDINDHKTVVTLTRFFADGRLRIFLGVILILAASYMLIASVSYLSHGAADQSVIQNSSTDQIASHPSDIENTTGWVGALLSHLLIYRWLGLGGFFIIFYCAALGITLVKLHRFRLWRLTFKSLVSAIAVSVIIGFLTYGTISPEYWGGEHGYYINDILITNASVWGAAAYSILMLVVLILIFANPLSNVTRHMRETIKRQKEILSERYRTSMAVARATMLQEQKKNLKENSASPEQQHATETAVKTAITSGPLTAATTPSDLFDDISASTPQTVTDTERRPLSEIPTESDTHGKSFTDTLQTETDTLRDIPQTTTDNAPTDSVNQPLVEIRTKKIEEAEEIDIDAYDPTAELSRYRFPTIDILHHRENAYSLTEEEQEENNQRIISTLDSYGIKIESIKATVGPTITLYEIVPQKGTRIATIKRLGDDMAMSLSAIGIRIIAPIPGKGTIGMEVPNKKPQTVGIRTILSSRAYHESTAELPMALGTTIANEVFVCDLAKMPHLLVAGATGMGKSVGLNTIIASLLFKKHPAELKFVLVDPKMVEFSLYKCIERHYLAKLPEEDEAIITDPGKVVATLNSLCLEMDNRYSLLSQAGMRGIKEYNQKFIQRRLNPEKGHRYLPYIVVVIDEFADLILTAGKEIENPISRIAAKARAVGIHMILATQRPSVNVITGTIKANFPGRMAFRVTQMNDSRTILDRPGAEQLIGRGDMLISRDGVVERVQCAFIDTDEVEALCKSISDQMGYPTAYELPENISQNDSAGHLGAVSDRDPMFADAGRAVIENGIGSASMLQRKFNIGYPRAGKIIDQLEAAGVVGATTGAGKPRPILMDLYSFERMLEN